MTDVGTTPRKALTPRQRLKLFEDHKGICIVCSQEIRAGEPWIDEHVRPLALGGSNDLSNRGPAHKLCAEVKTEQDMARIVKAKAQKRAALNIKPEGKPIPGKPLGGNSSKRSQHPMPVCARKGGIAAQYGRTEP